MWGLRQFSSHVTKCHACHGICGLSWRSPDNASRQKHYATRHVWTAAPATRKMKMEVSKVLRLPRTMQVIFWNPAIAPATRNGFWHVMKHVGMSRSATPATRNDVARRWKPPLIKSDHFCRGTARATSTRTVADGCGRLRVVADVKAASSEHVPTPKAPGPQAPKVKREPFATHSGKSTCKKGYIYICTHMSTIIIITIIIILYNNYILGYPGGAHLWFFPTYPQLLDPR